MKTIAIINQKGGTGKTTTSMSLASGLAYLDRQTLLIDLDPQSHSTIGLNVGNSHPEDTVKQLFSKRGYSVLQISTPAYIDGLDMVPSHISLARTANEMQTKLGKETYLRESLEGLNNQYEYVIIDCPPSLGILTVNALAAADLLIVPCRVSRYSLDGLSDLIGVIKEITLAGLANKSTGPPYRILLTMFDKRNKIANEFILDELDSIRDHVLDTIIMKNESLNQAQIMQESIFDYDPNSKGAENYKQLAREILQYE